MKLTILFLLTTLLCRAGDLDQGLAQIAMEQGLVLKFYKSPNDKNPVKVLELTYDSVRHIAGIKGGRASCEWLEPELFVPERSQFYLLCRSQNANWMELVVNEPNATRLWVRKSNKVKLISWVEFLSKMLYVSRELPASNPIYTRPDTNSERIFFVGQDFFKVKSIRGDWAEVYTPDDPNRPDELTQRLLTGWIRWKEDDILMIDYHTKN
jgi:hypothetical protein